MKQKAILETYWKILDDASSLLKDGEKSGRSLPHFSEESEDAYSTAGKQTRKDAAAAQDGLELEIEPEKTENRDQDSLEQIAEEIMHCTKCRLHETRRTPVPGAGAANPKVLIIGEAPGAQEDAAGIPFVGRAGKYLDKWLAAIQLSRTEDVFIGNIIKCRPPQNRDPFPDEQAACMPYLRRQIALLKPYSILCLGRIAAQIITGQETSLGRMRGTLHAFEGIPVVVTYHPSAVLRNPGQFRRPVWDDLQRLKKLLETHEVS